MSLFTQPYKCTPSVKKIKKAKILQIAVVALFHAKTITMTGALKFLK